MLALSQRETSLQSNTASSWHLTIKLAYTTQDKRQQQFKSMMLVTSGRITIKTSSYHYKNYHYNDRLLSSSWESLYIGRSSFYIEIGACFFFFLFSFFFFFFLGGGGGGGGGRRLFIAVSAEVILYPNFMGKCIVTLLSSVMPRVESSPQGTSNFTNEQLVRNEHVSFADLCRLNGAPQLISSLDSAPIRICYGFVLQRGAVNCPDVPLKSNWLVSQQKWCGLVLITMFCDCCVIYWNASCQEIWNQCKPYYNSNTLGPRQNGRRFADDIFKYIFLNESVWISVKILLKSVPNMMTSSNGNMFRVTGHLCGEFTGPGELLAQRPMTRSFDVSFDLRLNKRLSKQSWGWWFETQSRPLWRQCNECPINNIPSLVQIMVWRRPGDKPLSEPILVNLLTHMCVTRPQWVNREPCGLVQWRLWRLFHWYSNVWTGLRNWNEK